MEEHEVTEMDLIYEAHDKLDVLIELLIEKKVITQDEYNSKLGEYIERLQEEYNEEKKEN